MTDYDHTEQQGWRRPAPGDLQVIQLLVNSADVEDGSDALASGDALAQWLAEHGLAAPDESFSDDDVRRVIAVREGLRAALLSHNGMPLAAEKVAALDAEAARAPVTVRFGERGEPTLTAPGGGIDAAIARILAIAARAQADGTWERFKACAADTCQWAYYDYSRNRSRTWCSMETCGNRAKARAFRKRERGEA